MHVFPFQQVCKYSKPFSIPKQQAEKASNGGKDGIKGSGTDDAIDRDDGVEGVVMMVMVMVKVVMVMVMVVMMVLKMVVMMVVMRWND